MQFIQSTSLTLLLLALLTGCANKSDKHTHDESAATQHHDEESNALYLNNGEKWLVNEEMQPNILDAENILSSYVATGATDYKQLATQLKEKNDALIKSCTMSGESHEVLHIWLHPLLALTDSLMQASSIEEANKTITALQNSLTTYHTYFK